MADGFASLTSGLLARKGQARPAMRPQGFASPTAGLDDLGWNDMGHDGPRPIGVRLPTHLSGAQAIAAVPAVVRQQEDLAAAVETVTLAPPVAEPVLSLVAPVEPAAPPPVELVAAPAVVEPLPPVVLPPVALSEPAEPPVARRAAPKKAVKAEKTDVDADADADVAPRTTGRKAAFTLRLDVDRHLRLRLACAVENRSAQQLVIRALDKLLGEMPDVDRLAQSLPAANA